MLRCPQVPGLRGSACGDPSGRATSQSSTEPVTPAREAASQGSPCGSKQPPASRGTLTGTAPCWVAFLVTEMTDKSGVQRPVEHPPHPKDAPPADPCPGTARHSRPRPCPSRVADLQSRHPARSFTPDRGVLEWVACAVPTWSECRPESTATLYYASGGDTDASTCG